MNFQMRKIKQEKITQCQFTGIPFSKTEEVEFAHIDAVAYKPAQATNLGNGVIISKDIHKNLTENNIYTFEAMYLYCQKHGYALEWADNIT